VLPIVAVTDCHGFLFHCHTER